MANIAYVTTDFGTVITLDTKISLASATSQSIEIQYPDGTTASWSASVVDTTKVRYTTQSGDWNQSGNYVFQAKIAFSGVPAAYHGVARNVLIKALFATGLSV